MHPTKYVGPYHSCRRPGLSHRTWLEQSTTVGTWRGTSYGISPSLLPSNKMKILKNFLNICSSFFKRQTNLAIEKDLFHLLVPFPNVHSSQELHFGFPPGWKEPSYLDHHPLPSQVPDQEAGSKIEEPGLKLTF